MNEFQKMVKKIFQVFLGIIIWMMVVCIFSLFHDGHSSFLQMIVALVLTILFLDSEKEKRVAALFLLGMFIFFSIIGIASTIKIIIVVLLVIGICLFLIKTYNGNSLQIKNLLNNFQELISNKSTPAYENNDIPLEWKDFNHFNPFAGRYSYRTGRDYLIIRKGIIKIEESSAEGDTLTIGRDVERTLLQRMFGLCTITFYVRMSRKVYIVENINYRKSRRLIALIEHTGR